MGAKRDFALIKHGHTFGSLDDVDLAGLVDNSLIQYDAASGDWQDVTLANLNSQLDHGTLLGLSDDDHPQYPLAAGTEAISGAWTFSLTPTVPNDSWTYAKIQNVSATSRVLGRITAGSGDIEELTSTNLKTILALSSADISDFTEAAQDAALNVMTDSATIDFTYNDAGNSLTAIVIDASISNAKLRNSGALSVIGRSANSSGSPADISSASDDTLLIRTSSALSWGQLTAGMFPNSVVTYAKIQNVSATSRVLGRITAGAGVIEELTGANLATIIGTNLGANPSASVGLAAVNGSASTYMRSDGAPALDVGIAPLWSANHDWLDNAKVILGTGLDLQIYHDGTNSILNNATGQLQFYVPSGQQFYFEGPAGQMRLNSSTATNSAALLFYLGGANKARWGVEGTAGATITGSLVGDGFIVVLNSTRVIFGDVSTAQFYGAFAYSTTAADTRFMVYDVDKGALSRVSVGAANSGGAGFKLLRVPN